MRWGVDQLLRELPPSAADPFATFESELPSGEIFKGGSISKDYEATLDRLPLYQLRNVGSFARSVAAAQATTIGIPDYVIGDAGPLGSLGELLAVRLSQFTEGQVRDAAFGSLVQGAAMLVFSEALTMISSAVPIVGPLARYALFLVQGFRAAFRQVQIENPPPTVEAIAYSKAADTEGVQRRLEALDDAMRRGKPLTSFFLPFVRASTVKVSATITARGQTGRVVTVDGKSRDGFGHVPGLTDIGDFIQYPQVSPVQVGRGKPVGYASLHPSVSQFGVLLWQMVCKNGPLAFEIDGDAIASAWVDFYGTLNAYAAAGTGNEGAHRWAMISQLSCWAVTKTSGGAHSSIDGYGPEATKPVGSGRAFGNCDDVTCVPSKYVRWLQSRTGTNRGIYRAGMGPLVEYFVREQWRSQLSNFLRTITCAYVPYGAPALKADRGLADLHKAMRQRLLSHSAVRIVDPTNIRDSYYRNQVITAQKSATGDVKIATDKPSRLNNEILANLPPKVLAVVQRVAPIETAGLVLTPRSLSPGIPALDDEGGLAGTLLAATGAGLVGYGLYRLLRGRRA